MSFKVQFNANKLAFHLLYSTFHLMKPHFYLLAAVLILSNAVNWAGTVTVGGGSYTDTFPGVDVAARNGFPPGSPQLSGAAVGRPVPTNDWWSALLNTNHAGNLFNYPLAMGTLTYGLDIGPRWMTTPTGL
jgi:hypothetical protein